jgi:hypothetical protein
MSILFLQKTVLFRMDGGGLTVLRRSPRHHGSSQDSAVCKAGQRRRKANPAAMRAAGRTTKHRQYIFPFPHKTVIYIPAFCGTMSVVITQRACSHDAVQKESLRFISAQF